MSCNLELKSVAHRYGKKPLTFDAVSLCIAPGKIGALIGPSGCGKSTILRCIAGFEPVESGSILLDQEEVSSANKIVPPNKRRVGVVFQDYALFPHMTVMQNISFGIRAAQKKQKLTELIELVELDTVQESYPYELSGGQAQRVAIARALANEPRILLLDEPFSNLDPDLRGRMKTEVRRLLKHFNVTALLVTHDQDEAFDLADVMGVLKEGELRQWGEPYQLYHEPDCPETAEFVGASSFIQGKHVGAGVVDTELGKISIPDHSIKSNVKVLLRPDDIIHDDESPQTAEVTQINFRGMYLLYHLKLTSGQKIQCFTSSHHQHKVGDKIGVRLDMKHTVVFPDV